ncbi:MAG: hypothetical protein FWD23_03320, partial [Oscillospiraceae bacterium]|nr:hypothetical protein [Oscillospiraceae bacterium]
MTNGERFCRTFSFRHPGDRVPVYEWAPWWDKTVDRWKTEGIDPSKTFQEILDDFGLDKMSGLGASPFWEGAGT